MYRAHLTEQFAYGLAIRPQERTADGNSLEGSIIKAQGSRRKTY